jgi:hypothetical protein
MTAPSIMDMYALLGVNQDSSMTDVKRAYRQLALLYHPDKGGNVNDMRIIKNACDWICNDIDIINMENEKGTYEERNAEFQEFIKSQEKSSIPSFSQIEFESLVQEHITIDDIDKTYERYPDNRFLRDIAIRRMLYVYMNRDEATMDTSIDTIMDDIDAIEKQGTSHASIPGGYGELLDCSMENTNASTTTVSTTEKEEVKCPFGKMSLTLYKNQEPTYLNMTGFTPCEIPASLELEDYSLNKLCDYRVAYTETTDMYSELNTHCSQKGMYDQKLEDIMHVRSDMDEVAQSVNATDGLVGNYLQFKNLHI